MTAIQPDVATGIVESLYRAFNERDAEGALANIAPGVDWQDDITGARIVGRDALRAHWQKQWAESDTRVAPMRIAVADDGKVVVRVDRLVRDLSGNVLVHDQAETVFTFEGLFVARVDSIALPENDDDDEDDKE